MNTTRSDQIAGKWSKTTNPLKSACVHYQRDFTASAATIFPLLCPVTEYDWLPGWNCELLHSESGYTEYNVVFKTTFFGPEETWVCTRFEPNKAIEYARFSTDICGKMEISLVENADGTTTGKWVLRASALNQNGNKAVEALETAGQEVGELLKTLEHYVATGEMVA